MKHLPRFAAAVLSAGLLVAQAPPNVKARQDRQDARIEKGKADGSLTDAEAKKLEARDKALDAKIRRDRKDGGGLTVKERKRIQKLQNKESKAIHNPVPRRLVYWWHGDGPSHPPRVSG